MQTVDNGDGSYTHTISTESYANTVDSYWQKGVESPYIIYDEQGSKPAFERLSNSLRFLYGRSKPTPKPTLKAAICWYGEQLWEDVSFFGCNVAESTRTFIDDLQDWRASKK